MDTTLVGGTGQQRQWVEEALRRVTYPLDKLDVTLTVTWPTEPPCPGHKEFACTTTPDGLVFAMTIREAFDSSTDPDYSGRAFYEETTVHELGHVITFGRTNLTDREAMCVWFIREVSGEGTVRGTAAQLNNTAEPWEDRIQEAMAETIKDAILPDAYREYDNRTSWRIDPDHYEDFMTVMMPPDVPAGETVVGWSDGASGPHVPPEVWADNPGVIFTIDPTDHFDGGAEGYTLPLRFRFGSDDPTPPYLGTQDYAVIVPAGQTVELGWDFLTADLGGGIVAVVALYWLDGVLTTLQTFPVPEHSSYWAQWTIRTPEVATEAPPPYPYRDPHIGGGGGDTAVFRFA